MYRKYSDILIIFLLITLLCFMPGSNAEAQSIGKNHAFDTDNNWTIGDFELLNAIDEWAIANMGDFDLLDLIDFWAFGSYCWDYQIEKYRQLSCRGILLEGPTTSLASDFVYDFDSGDRTTDDEISTGAGGIRVDRTNVSIAFSHTATVNDLNALLSSINGTIVNMLPEVNIILVKIPDPVDIPTLDALITEIEGKPIVRRVTKAFMVEPASLPGNHDWVSPNVSMIDHNIAVHAPAAWNAKAALDYDASSPPLLLIADSFGGGRPNNDFNLNILNPDHFKIARRPDTHGYSVLGIISGRHNVSPSDTSNRKLVTGIYPGTLTVNAVDITGIGKYNISALEWEIIRRINSSSINVVMNTSLSIKCSTSARRPCVEPYAHKWLEKVRGWEAYSNGTRGALEDRLLHLTAAGNYNILVEDTYDAPVASQFTAARLLSDMKTKDGVAVPNLDNTLVVENRRNTESPYKPGCLHDFSKFPGDISAIGTNIWSFTGASSGSRGDQWGTSLSSPQVAGLAAYVWALKPSLTPQDVMAILIGSSDEPTADSGCPEVPAPVIDAYAAILAVDSDSVLGDGLVNPLDAPARLAILDVADNIGDEGTNRAFDHHDLFRFISELDLGSGLNLDYSRYDLNGDGYTGSTDKVSRFNLDIDDMDLYTMVEVRVDSEDFEIDENNVSDWEVLCYYTYSPLYTGDNARRDTLMAPHKDKCGTIPDLNRMLYGRLISHPYDSNRKNAIFSMRAIGGDVTQLTNEENTRGNPSSASWSTDLQKIVYAAGVTGSADIWVMNSDGTGHTNLTNDSVLPRNPDREERDDGNPSWSPDGSKIVFERSRSYGSIAGTGSWIYSINVDGTNLVRLTAAGVAAIESDPVWSPDGSKIAFSTVRHSSGSEIYVMNADGSNHTRLTNSDGLNRTVLNLSPIWSPGGSMIYFLSNRDLNPDFSKNVEIYSMNADGSNQRNLTNSAEDEGSISINPEGSKIAYRIAFNYQYDIFVMGINGDNQLRITNTEFNSEGPPVWSPDSTEIAFSVYRSQSDIFVVNSHGGDLWNVTGSFGGGFGPTDWR